MKIDWVRKLTSRKLWAMIANFTSMMLVFFNCPESQATQIAALIIAGGGIVAYILAEGFADGSNAIEQKEDNS